MIGRWAPQIEAQLRKQRHRAAIAGLTFLAILPCFWAACKVRRTTATTVAVTTMTVTPASAPSGALSDLPAAEFGSDEELADFLGSLRGVSVQELDRQMSAMGAGSCLLLISFSDPDIRGLTDSAVKDLSSRVTTMATAAITATQPGTDHRRIYTVSKPRPGTISVQIKDGSVVSAEYEPD